MGELKCGILTSASGEAYGSADNNLLWSSEEEIKGKARAEAVKNATDQMNHYLRTTRCPDECPRKVIEPDDVKVTLWGEKSDFQPWEVTHETNGKSTVEQTQKLTVTVTAKWSVKVMCRGRMTSDGPAVEEDGGGDEPKLHCGHNHYRGVQLGFGIGKEQAQADRRAGKDAIEAAGARKSRYEAADCPIDEDCKYKKVHRGAILTPTMLDRGWIGEPSSSDDLHTTRYYSIYLAEWFADVECLEEAPPAEDDGGEGADSRVDSGDLIGYAPQVFPPAQKFRAGVPPGSDASAPYGAMGFVLSFVRSPAEAISSAEMGLRPAQRVEAQASRLAPTRMMKPSDVGTAAPSARAQLGPGEGRSFGGKPIVHPPPSFQGQPGSFSAAVLGKFTPPVPSSMTTPQPVNFPTSSFPIGQSQQFPGQLAAAQGVLGPAGIPLMPTPLIKPGAPGPIPGGALGLVMGAPGMQGIQIGQFGFGAPAGLGGGPTGLGAQPLAGQPVSFAAVDPGGGVGFAQATQYSARADVPGLTADGSLFGPVGATGAATLAGTAGIWGQGLVPVPIEDPSWTNCDFGWCGSRTPSVVEEADKELTSHTRVCENELNESHLAPPTERDPDTGFQKQANTTAMDYVDRSLAAYGEPRMSGAEWGWVFSEFDFQRGGGYCLKLYLRRRKVVVFSIDLSCPPPCCRQYTITETWLVIKDAGLIITGSRAERRPQPPGFPKVRARPARLTTICVAGPGDWVK